MQRPDGSQAEQAGAVAAGFRYALRLAAEQIGATAPNPTVGCVLLDAEGQIIAAAAHLGAGQPHAEARAISLAQDKGLTASIDSVIVTLEPCNHQGRTGPCSEAILTTPAKTVWYALPDPNPPASGGAARLRAAGLAVHDLSELEHPSRDELLIEARRLLAPFVTRVTLGRPYVTVKQALDAAGSMIPPVGQKTFTSAKALTLAHQLRRRADAILTGSGTVLADRAEFTVRHVTDIAGKSRILCILDRRGRVGEAYLEAARGRGFRVMIATDLAAALRDLAAAGCNEVLVEAGQSLLDSLREAGLWDEWVLIEKATATRPERITVTYRHLTD